MFLHQNCTVSAPSRRGKASESGQKRLHQQTAFVHSIYKSQQNSDGCRPLTPGLTIDPPCPKPLLCQKFASKVSQFQLMVIAPVQTRIFRILWALEGPN